MTAAQKKCREQKTPLEKAKRDLKQVATALSSRKTERL